MSTTDERKVQLGVEVDGSGARAGFADVKSAAVDMANGVAAAGAKAGAAVDGIGAGAGESSAKFDRATSSILRSVERATAALQAGKKSGADFWEALAVQRGANMDVLKPVLEQYRQLEKVQPAANQALANGTAALGAMGVSAKQTAAALRGVPAQFTDIITSLQGGQAPITVLLQQGGQLKDMFGGIGPAAKALGGYVAGLINPLTIGAAAVGAMAVAMYQGSKEAGAYERALILTNNAAGTTAAQMQAMATRISAVVGTQGAAAEALAAMAGSGQVASANLEKFAATAVRMERDVGQSVADTVKTFADLAKSPVEASIKLNEQTGYLTASILEQIIALKAQGKEAEAGVVAQKAYSDAMDGISARLVNNLGTVERAWLGIKDAIKAVWDGTANIGRASTQAQQLALVSGEIAQRQGQDKNRPFTMPWEESLDVLKQRQAYLQEQVRLEQRGAEAAGARAQANKAASEAIDAVNKANEKALSKQEQLNKALAEYRSNVEKIRTTAPNSILVTAEQIAKTEKAIREQFKETAKGGSGDSELASLKARVIAADDYLARLKAQGLEADKLTEGEKIALRLQEELKGKLDARTRSIKEQSLAEAQKLATSEKATEAYKEQVKFIGDMDKAQQKFIEGAYKTAAGISDQADKQAAANATFGLGKAALQEFTLAQMEKNRADLAATSVVLPAYIAALDESIAAQKRLVAGLRTGEDLSAGKAAAEQAAKAAQEAQEAWQKSADQIQQSLTDALMNAFMAGKGFGKTFVDGIKSMFNTMVLRPVISAIVNPVAGAVTGALGLASPVSAATSGVSALSNASGLFGLGTFGSSASSVAAGIYGGIGELSSLGIGEAVSAGLTGVLEGSFAAGFGTIAGALGPIGVGLAAVYAIAKNLDHSGTLHTGGGSTYSAATGLQTTAGGASFGGGYNGVVQSQGTIDMTSELVKSIVGILDSTAVAFGRSAGYQAATSFADDTSRDGAWGTLLITKMGEVLTNWGASNTSGNWTPERTFSDGAAGTAEYLAAISKDMLSQVQQIITGADWAAPILDAIGSAPSLDQLSAAVAKINKTQTALVGMGKVLSGFSSLSSGAVAALIKAAGGIDNLSTAASTYYDNFYSQAEKTANVTTAVSDALAAVGLQMPATRADFRALVESQQALGEAGAPALAALLQVSGAFASIVPAAEDVATVVDDMAASVARSADDIAASLQRLKDTTGSLQVDLLTAQGDPAGAAALRRTLETTGFTAAELAVYDYNQSLRDQIAALNDAQGAAQAAADAEVAAARSAADQRASIEQRILQLQGNTTALRAAELATLAPANRALQEMVYSLEDAATAAQQTAAAQAEKSGLERQLLQLQGDTAALRALEIAALDPANRAIQERIYALQDEQTAAAEAARTQSDMAAAARAAEQQQAAAAQAAAAAAQAVADQRASLEQRILQLQGNTAALREAELATLAPANRALQEMVYSLEDAAAAAQKAAAVQSEREGLQRQLLQLQGDTAALRQMEMAALDPANRAIQEQIYALQDQKDAADKAANAATQLANTWASLGDSLRSEVDRIRGLITEQSTGGYASLQAQFAIATAQARALDQDAAKLLPTLSASLLESYAKSATSLTDLQRMQALTANSLETTANIIGAATGTAGADTTATTLATRDGRTLTAMPVPAGQAGGAAPYSLADMVVELRAEIAALKTEVKGLRSDSTTQQESIAINTGKTARILDKFDIDGVPAVRA